MTEQQVEGQQVVRVDVRKALAAEQIRLFYKAYMLKPRGQDDIELARLVGAKMALEAARLFTKEEIREIELSAV